MSNELLSLSNCYGFCQEPFPIMSRASFTVLAFIIGVIISSYILFTIRTVGYLIFLVVYFIIYAITIIYYTLSFTLSFIFDTRKVVTDLVTNTAVVVIKKYYRNEEEEQGCHEQAGASGGI